MLQRAKQGALSFLSLSLSWLSHLTYPMSFGTQALESRACYE